MTRTVSTNTKVEQLRAMLGSRDLTDWEQGFVQNVSDNFAKNKSSASLTDRQLEIVDRIWGKHFA